MNGEITRKSPNTRRSRVLAGITGTALLFVACSNDKDPKHTAATSGSVVTGAADNNGEAVIHGWVFTFNDLDPNADALIDVYTDYTEAGRGTSFDAFAPGATVEALCKVIGREVSSHPERHEEKRTSSQWIGIADHDGMRAYATAVYGDISSEDLNALPPC